MKRQVAVRTSLCQLTVMAALAVMLTCPVTVSADCPVASQPDFWRFWLDNGAGAGTGQGSDSIIPHVPVPAPVGPGVMNSGLLGINEFASQQLQAQLNDAGKEYATGMVSVDTGVPISKTGGYELATEEFYDDFSEGLSADNFNILVQKKSTPDNVDVVQDTVNGVTKNVLRLTAKTETEADGTPYVSSTGLIQTQQLYASGRFEALVRFPPVKGLVSALWTFHYESHFEQYANEDPQYVPGVAHKGTSITNHEIDIEMPASCKGMCENDACVGDFSTMNLNNYVFTNNAGTGPAYANLCAKNQASPFIDDEYHEYAIEWHTGDIENQCVPRTDFFWDGQYIGSNNVFVPSRGSRFVMGIWDGSLGWVGVPEFEEAYAYISHVRVTPFGEAGDAMYPQTVDQPNYHPTWTTKTVPGPHAFVSTGTKQPSATWRKPDTGELRNLVLAGCILAVAVSVLVLGAVVFVVRRSKRNAERRHLLASTDSISLSALENAQLEEQTESVQEEQKQEQEV